VKLSEKKKGGAKEWEEEEGKLVENGRCMDLHW
jgi:hypothetical protein